MRALAVLLAAATACAAQEADFQHDVIPTSAGS